MNIYYLLLNLFICLVTALPQQNVFMKPDDHGDIWSLCGDSTQHLLRGYKEGVSISPAMPKTGEDIRVKVEGSLLRDINSGLVDIDLMIMNMIKIKKQLNLCDVLESEVMGYKSCPLKAGDIVLDVTAWIPKELPKLPLTGNILISDNEGNTVTCIHLDFKLT
ncbi:hypothetical protein BDB01DRAFT_795689 [Pilobolus umbonatus]|nr:hypothetical protein BDB01DRAFT_795689 [Pilobolus umbonatus]